MAASLGLTLLMLATGFHGHMVAPTVDLVFDTVALVVCVALTVLAWSRFRESHIVAAACHAAAFQALAVAYGFAVLESLQHGDSIGRLAKTDDVQPLVFAIAQLGAAVLFVLAGAFTNRPEYGRHAAWIPVVPSLAVVGAGLVGAVLGPPPEALRILVPVDLAGLPSTTVFGAALHMVGAVLFFVGAYVSRGLLRTGGAALDGWIAIGLIFAGFGELHWTLYPSAHPGQVSTGDVFRLACSTVFLVGLEAAVRGGLRDLRAANARLADVRDLEVQQAAMEERTRLARELHDGLAQDLWLAKLRTGELVAMSDLSDAARHAAQAAAAAIEVGPGEAREAVAALRQPPDASAGFGDTLRRAVEECGDRYGLRVEFSFEGDLEARPEPRAQAEILRITQEALTNAARHADASVVGVRLMLARDRITLRVVDNGRGFDPSVRRPNAFGLVSMQQRAALIGGRLRVASRMGEGTSIVLTAPFARGTAAVEA